LLDYRNSETVAAIEARNVAAATGTAIGENLVKLIQQTLTDPNLDPYLEYLTYIGAAQVVANEGRRVGGIDFTKADKDLEGKKGRTG
jgi:hypothetical protein